MVSAIALPGSPEALELDRAESASKASRGLRRADPPVPRSDPPAQACEAEFRQRREAPKGEP